MKVCPNCSREWSDDHAFCPYDGTTLRGPASVTDLVGTVIAERYRIEKKLGEGGMGAVYLGEHVRMGSMAAIKVISRHLADDPDAVARFSREARNAARTPIARRLRSSLARACSSKSAGISSPTSIPRFVTGAK